MNNSIDWTQVEKGTPVTVRKGILTDCEGLYQWRFYIVPEMDGYVSIYREYGDNFIEQRSVKIGDIFLATDDKYANFERPSIILNTYLNRHLLIYGGGLRATSQHLLDEQWFKENNKGYSLTRDILMHGDECALIGGIKVSTKPVERAYSAYITVEYDANHLNYIIRAVFHKIDNDINPPSNSQLYRVVRDLAETKAFPNELSRLVDMFEHDMFYKFVIKNNNLK